jgi:hypothetical protein
MRRACTQSSCMAVGNPSAPLLALFVAKPWWQRRSWSSRKAGLRGRGGRVRPSDLTPVASSYEHSTTEPGVSSMTNKMAGRRASGGGARPKPVPASSMDMWSESREKRRSVSHVRASAQCVLRRPLGPDHWICTLFYVLLSDVGHLQRADPFDHPASERVRADRKMGKSQPSGPTQIDNAVRSCPCAPISASDLDLKCVGPDSARVLLPCPSCPPLAQPTEAERLIFPLPLDRRAAPAQNTSHGDGRHRCHPPTTVECSAVDQVA